MDTRDAFAEAAFEGDAYARRRALDIAADAIEKGEPLPPALRAFIVRGLQCIADGTGKDAAKAAAFFAKAKRQPANLADILAAVQAVEDYRRQGYSLTTTEATTERAKPSAYITVAERYALEPITVETWYKRYRFYVAGP